MTINNRKPEGLDLPSGARRGGNCGVTAVAIAAGVSFDQAWDLFKKHCSRIRRNKKWTGDTFTHERTLIMKKLGLKYEVIPQRKLRDDKTVRMPSLKKFVEWNTKKGVLYIVTTTHHVQLVQDGWVIDQHGSKLIDDFWGKNKKVEEVEFVIPKRKTESKGKFANAKIYPMTDINPRKEKTIAYHAFQIILDNPGITYEDYLSKGGRYNDLAYDNARNRCFIEKGN
ncbi:MAG: hypothetical protein CMB80_01660 [Flammeovirgaceae bacterium]|nr:hypothetical protein [Flammeovirgaceae bacterium]